MKKKFVIFDFDGTLVNTNDVIIASWQAAARRFLGHELPVRDIERTFGETLKYTIEYLMPNEDYIEVRDCHREYQKEHCEGMVYVFEGIVPLLEELKKRGCTLAVATSRTITSFNDYMKSLDLAKYFDVSVVMEDVTHHKPHPESLQVALEKLGAKPEEAIMVGDTKYDIGCANNAGVDSVLIRWSHYVDDEEMAELGYKPTYYIDKPEDLLTGPCLEGTESPRGQVYKSDKFK